MAIEAGKDYVLAPKVTRTGGAGILEALLVGTKKFLFLIPFGSIGGAGRTIETRTYTLAEGDPRETVPVLLATDDLTVEALEEFLKSALDEGDGQIVEIESFDQFKIEVGGGLLGWLKAGLYYKTGGQRGWTGMAVSGKQNRQALYDFYADQLRPDG